MRLWSGGVKYVRRVSRRAAICIALTVAALAGCSSNGTTTPTSSPDVGAPGTSSGRAGFDVLMTKITSTTQEGTLTSCPLATLRDIAESAPPYRSADLASLDDESFDVSFRSQPRRDVLCRIPSQAVSLDVGDPSPTPFDPTEWVNGGSSPLENLVTDPDVPFDSGTIHAFHDDSIANSLRFWRAVWTSDDLEVSFVLTYPVDTEPDDAAATATAWLKHLIPVVQASLTDQSSTVVVTSDS